MSTPELEGKVAIVTGASRGIGTATAAALHRRGARVVLVSRSQEAVAQAASETGDRAVGIAAHVADEEAASACVKRVMDDYGQIDILVNNAGTNPAYGPVIDQTHARFTKTMDVNLWAPVLWTGLAVRASMAARGGVVVNTSSIGGQSVLPNLALYHASKAALNHLTRHMALELGPGVRVNAVSPGVVRTKLSEALWRDNEEAVAAATPLGRIGEPDDVGEAVAFLSGDGARWITGATFVVDGGQLLSQGVP